MSIDIDELERLARRATPGPWMVNDDKGSRWVETFGDDIICKVSKDSHKREQFDANSKLIAAANPTTILELIKRLRDAEKERDELKHDNHNINVALGTDGYHDWFNEEERTESKNHLELVHAGLERMRQRALELAEQKRKAAAYDELKARIDGGVRVYAAKYPRNDFEIHADSMAVYPQNATLIIDGGIEI